MTTLTWWCKGFTSNTRLKFLLVCSCLDAFEIASRSYIKQSFCIDVLTENTLTGLISSIFSLKCSLKIIALNLC